MGSHVKAPAGEPSPTTMKFRTLTRIEQLLTWDRRISAECFHWYNDRLPYARGVLLFLELTGHGALWLMWPLMIFARDAHMTAGSLATLFHFYLGNLFDLLAITMLKPTFRRLRPHYNSGLQVATVHAVDKFSFPSGHASRVAFVTAFAIYAALWRPESIPNRLMHTGVLCFLILWAIAVSASRVALGRHHVLDVVFGIILGISYVLILHVFWISDNILGAKRDEWLANSLTRFGNMIQGETCAVN